MISINKFVNYKRSSYYEVPSRSFSRQWPYTYFQGFRNEQEVNAFKTLKYEFHVQDIQEDRYYFTGNEFHLICEKKPIDKFCLGK